MLKKKPAHIGTLSPEMALLGLLYGAAGHGYDLHRKVVGELSQVWHLSQSQAYSILKRLAVQGDISTDQNPQEEQPFRQLLRITRKGRQRFLEWLNATSGGSTRAIRMEFVTRLYFLNQYFPEKVAHAFELQREAVKFHIRRLENTRDNLLTDDIYNRMSLDLRLTQLQSVLEWLDECQKHFQ